MESNNLIFNKNEENNQIKSVNKFKNIKSKYILKKVFNNLERKKLFNILKYNNEIKKRINININDYKEYSEKYTLIEIEIKPVNNKYGEFISNKYKKYYHIYFNNNEEEIKRNFILKDEQIKKIKIIIDYHIESFKELFDDCKCIESIYFKKSPTT